MDRLQFDDMNMVDHNFFWLDLDCRLFDTLSSCIIMLTLKFFGEKNCRKIQREKQCIDNWKIVKKITSDDLHYKQKDKKKMLDKVI